MKKLSPQDAPPSSAQMAIRDIGSGARIGMPEARIDTNTAIMIDAAQLAAVQSQSRWVEVVSPAEPVFETWVPDSEA